MTLPNFLRQLAGWLALALVVRANDPGGGAFEKSAGKVTSYRFNGTQMLDTSGLIY